MRLRPYRKPFRMDSLTPPAAPAPEVRATKMCPSMPIEEGSSASWSITVGNFGDGPITSPVVVQDILPAEVSYDPASITGGDSNDDSGAPTLQWTINNLAPGQNKVLKYTATVQSGAAASSPITNSATVSDGGGPAVGDPSCDFDVIAPVQPTVSATKEVSPNPAEEGTTVTYTLTITNSGPAAILVPVVVTDAMPAFHTYVPASITGGDSNDDADPDGAGLQWTLNSLVAGQSRVLTYEAQLDPGTDGLQIVNTATVTDGGGPPVPDPQSTLDVFGSEDPPPQLEATKTADPLVTEENGFVAFIISVTNTGDGPITSTVTITDVVPTGFTYAGPGNIIGGDTRNDSDPAGAGLQWTITSLNAGEGRNLVFGAYADTGSAALSPIRNQAQVSSGGGPPVPDPFVDVTVTAPGGPALSIAKTPDGATVTEGDTVLYQIQVTNVGDRATTGPVTIDDTVPAELTYVPGSIAGGDSRTAAGAPNLQWTLNSLSAGQSRTVSYQVTVGFTAAENSPVVNTATASGGGADPVQDTGSITADPTSPVVVASKNAAPNPTPEGGSVTFQLTITNTGDGPITAPITITDVVPTGFTYNPGEIIGGDTRNDADPAGAGLQWTINLLNPGQSKNLFFGATADPGSAALSPIRNTAQVSSGGGPPVTDPFVDVTVQGPVLSISKTPDGVTVEEGSTVIYQIQVSNIGNAPTSGPVTVTDTVPSDLSYIPGTISGGDSRNASAAPSLSWTLSTLNPGQTRAMSYHAKVGWQASQNSPIVNTAHASGGGADPVQDDGSINVTNVQPLIAGTKTVSDDPTNTGSSITYTISLSNSGGGTDFPVTVVDKISQYDFTYTPNSIRALVNGVPKCGSFITCDQSSPYGSGLAWVIPEILPGDDVVLRYDVSVRFTAASSVTNTASVTGGGGPTPTPPSYTITIGEEDVPCDCFGDASRIPNPMRVRFSNLANPSGNTHIQAAVNLLNGSTFDIPRPAGNDGCRRRRFFSLSTGGEAVFESDYISPTTFEGILTVRSSPGGFVVGQEFFDDTFAVSCDQARDIVAALGTDFGATAQIRINA